MRYIKKHSRLIIISLLCLVFLGGLAVIVSYCILKENADNGDFYTVSSENTVSASSTHNMLNGTGGYTDIYLHSPADQTNAGALPDISLYCSQSGDCYFFLPSGTPLSEYTISFDENLWLLTINGFPIHSGDSLDAYTVGIAYSFTVSEASDTLKRTLTFIQSENLPAVFITTATGSLDYLNASKDNKEPGDFICLNADGSIDSRGALASMKGHGNSSYDDVEKKSFQITFDTAQDVLSMGSAEIYILQANAFDDTYLRNKIVYEYCKDLQIPYVVDAEYIDLYFNGEYAGNYLLCEKVELGENRIDISDCYLIEKILHDRIQDGDQVFQVTGMQDFLVKNSVPVSDTELQNLSEYMNTVEELIKDCDSSEKYDALKEYIDVDSFVDMYLVNAITNDIDSNIASTYYYKKNDTDDSRLYAGPVWDYDNAWGRAERGYVADCNAYPTGYCEELFAIDDFRDAVAEKYNAAAYPLMQEYLTNQIPALIELTSSSIAMDALRWQDEGYHSHYYEDYDSSVAYLTSYMETRLEHLYDRLNHPENYHYVLFVNATSSTEYRDTEYWIRDGETIPDEVMEEVSIHFHCKTFSTENGENYDTECPIYKDMILYGN